MLQHRIADLEQIADQICSHPACFDEFTKAFNSYADFYRGHMMLEEEVVLPLIRRHLTEQDWAEVDQEFLAEMEAKSGKDGSSENFAAMFSRLVECAPSPVGYGPRPYTD